MSESALTGAPQSEEQLNICLRPEAKEPRAARTSGPIGLLEEFRASPPVRGQGLWRTLHRGVQAVNRAVEAGLPVDLNPLAQAGAMANVTFLVALLSGILLLFWYSPSVHQAYASLDALRGSRFGQLMRSLHRYSSDLCMLFVLLHLLQVTAAQLFTGSRWLAWITGIALTAFLWLDGWTGYWLVWDERARQIALASARMLDVIPIFAEPFSRSFLTDESVTTLHFFIVFFVHMLIPLAMGIGLWLHISRLSRSRFLTNRRLAAATVAGLVAVSLLAPAYSDGPARMTVIPAVIRMDAWYMAPLGAMERAGAGALWLLGFAGAALASAAPWLLAKRRPAPVRVIEARCNGCAQCFHDCPYNAITMTVGEEERPGVAAIDSSLCVGCGICVGSCNPAAIDYTHLPVKKVREQIAAWFECVPVGDAEALAFLCTHSAAAHLRVDTAAGLSADLPAYRIVPVPCTGWVHPFMIERALKKGYTGVLVVGCHTMPLHREGAEWTAQRIESARLPHLRPGKINGARILYRRFDRAEKELLLQEAERFRAGGVVSAGRQGLRGVGQIIAASLLVGALGFLTVGLAGVSHAVPAGEVPQLVVSFRHPGQRIDQVGAPAADDPSIPVHMRGAPRVAGTGERRRADVRLRISVDGAIVLAKSFPPHGIFGDGASVAMERLEVPVGEHRVRIEIGETADSNEWTYRAEQTVDCAPRSQRVILFEEAGRFSWH